MGCSLDRWSWPAVLLPVGDSTCATLNEDWDVEVLGCSFRIPRRTQTDGASIPRFLWRLCGHPLESPRVYAALVHDWLYSGGLPGMDRATADRIYRELLVRYGWGRARAWTEYFAIRLFGRSHWYENY